MVLLDVAFVENLCYKDSVFKKFALDIAEHRKKSQVDKASQIEEVSFKQLPKSQRCLHGCSH